MNRSSRAFPSGLAARVLPVAILVPLVVAAPASAAPRAGSYSGTTKASVHGHAWDEPRIDRGKVTFKVSGLTATTFKVRGQQATCGGQVPDVDFTVKRLRLSSAGKGRATHRHEVLGEIRVSITVTGRGTSSGKIVFGGLCGTTASFSAKRRS